jgi:hypothetical protein
VAVEAADPMDQVEEEATTAAAAGTREEMD